MLWLLARYALVVNINADLICLALSERNKNYDWNMSHSNFSIRAVPIIFSKNVFSTLFDTLIRKFTSNISNLPYRFWFPGQLVSTWFFSMASAWSCKFSTCPVSFNPWVSRMDKSHYKTRDMTLIIFRVTWFKQKNSLHACEFSWIYVDVFKSIKY